MGQIYVKSGQRNMPISNGLEIPQVENTKRLGLHLDRRLNWKKLILTELKQVGFQLGKMYWLLGNNSQLSAENKLPLYKTIFNPFGFMASNCGPSIQI